LNSKEKSELEDFINGIPSILFEAVYNIPQQTIKFQYLNEKAKEFLKRFVSKEHFSKEFHVQDILISNEQQSQVQKELQKVISGEKVVIENREVLLRNLENNEIIISTSYAAERDNDSIYVRGMLYQKSLVTVEDITEEQMLPYNRALKEVEIFRDFFSMFGALILILDKEGNLQFVSPNANESILYKPREKIIGKNIREIFSKGQAEFFMSYHEKACKKGEYITFEYHLPINNRLRWFQCRLVPIINKKSDNEQVVAIIRDITKWRVEKIIQ
jgi:PAS domain S-box-containing protein